MRKAKLPHVKAVTAKGRRYEYFDTGQRTNAGKPILKRLPSRDDPGFGASYAAMLAGRSRRAAVAALLTVPQLIELYQRSPEFRKLAPATQTLYRTYCTRIAAEMPNAPAGEIERRDFLRLRDKMAETTGAANGMIRTAGALYAWARRREHVTNEPTKGVTLFDSEDYPPWPEPLLDAALATDVPYIRLAVSLLYFTAQRIGDVCALRWSDVRDGRVQLTQQKTGAELDFPQHKDLAALLDATPKRGLTILADEAGRPFSVDRLRDHIQLWAADRGHRVVPHGLRKNAVNALLEAGCSAAETGAVSGQSLALVEHYGKRRSRRRLGSAAILKMEGAKR